jgi:hypothetical protein
VIAAACGPAMAEPEKRAKSEDAAADNAEPNVAGSPPPAPPMAGAGASTAATEALGAMPKPGGALSRRILLVLSLTWHMVRRFM